MNRRALVAVVAAVAIVSAGIGWLAGQRIKSPAEIAAEQGPPEPSLITVPVERRELSQSLVVRGTARSNEAAPLDAKSTSGELIITRLVKEEGAQLDEGDVMIEVAGRPIFVLEGQLPVFRSMIPTLDGPDVKQLEEALVRLGFDPGTVDGVYDGATADAVEKLYRDAGYSPVEPTDQDLTALKDQRQTVSDAQVGVSQAQASLTEAQAGPPESTRIRLDQAVDEAKAALDQALADAGGAALTDATTAAEQAAAQAKTAADEAASRLSRAKGGSHPDTGQAPTEAELAELEAANTAAAQAKADADKAVTEAKAAEDSGSGESAEVKAARSNLALAEADRREGLATDTAAANRALQEARKQLTEANASLAEIEAVVDTQFPAAEFYFLPSLPRKIQTLSVETGQQPTGPVMTVTGSGTSIISGVAAADRRLIDVGDTAILEDEALGISAEATITFIADSPGGGELPSDRYRIRIEPNEDLPEDALNVNFRITIPVTSSGGEVLAVPLAALSAGADGTTRVEVERSAGETELVRVTPGLRADGFVEIDVLEGSLDVGDRVVVGRDLVLPGDVSPGDDQADDDEVDDPRDSDDSGDSDDSEDET